MGTHSQGLKKKHKKPEFEWEFFFQMKIFLLIKKSGNLCEVSVISTPAVNFGQSPELVENYHNKRVLDLPVLAVLVFTKRWQDHRHNIVRAARSGLALASLGGGKYGFGTFWCCSSGMWCWSQERQDVTMGSSRPLHIHHNWSGASLVWSDGAESYHQLYPVDPAQQWNRESFV